jgi:hypothetical protein
MKDNTKSFMAGLLSGFTQTIFGYPFDTIKVQMQTKKFNYNNINIKLFNGLCYPLLTQSLINSVMFGTFNLAKSEKYSNFASGSISGIATGILVTPIELAKVNEQVGNNNNNYSILMSGGLAGLFSWSITYPIDVIKTRIQVNKHITITNAILKGKLYSGITPCLIRAIIVNSIGFYVYEKIMKLKI